MTIHDLTVRADTLAVTWADMTTTEFPTIWLRDNCPSGLHPQTHERLLDLLSLEDAPVLSSAEFDGNDVQLIYADGHISQLPPHCYRSTALANEPLILPQLKRGFGGQSTASLGIQPPPSWRTTPRL